MVRHCPSCDSPIYSGEDVCSNCGSDLADTDRPEPAIAFRGRFLGTHLDELGAPEPVLLDAATSVDEVVDRMHRDGLDCVLVMDRGRLVGVFTDRDAVLKVAGRRHDDRPIAAVMTRDPVVLRRDDPIAVAIHKMAVGGFRHVPIVDDGRPIGVVSARDVFRHIASRLG